MMPIEPDHYGVLELKPGSPMEDVKSQYRRLAKRYHPDLHGDDAGFQEKFRRVNAAYIFLSDAARKASYDAVLQAARKAGVPPLRSAPPTTSRPAPTATGYHARPTTTGYYAPPSATGFRRSPQDQTGTDVRMKRSAWLGATAGAIVVLLVIGLSLNGSGPGRSVPIGAGSPTAPGSVAGSALGSGRGDRLENESEPGADVDPAVDPSPPFTAPDAGAVLPRRPSPVFPRPAAAMPPGIAGSTATLPRAKEAPPAEALGTQLAARYHAVLPRTDRLLGRGYAVRAASADMGDGSRRILQDKLATDLADLSAARGRVQPGVVHLSKQGTPTELHQEAGRVLADLHQLENAQQPVQDDIKALAAMPPVLHASLAASRVSTLSPAKAASIVSVPTIPTAPVVAPVAPPSPKPPEKVEVKPAAKVEVKPAAKVEVKPAAKPKPPAASGQEFVLWGK